LNAKYASEPQYDEALIFFTLHFSLCAFCFAFIRIYPGMEIELRTTTWLDEKEVLERARKALIRPLMECGALVESEAKTLFGRGGKELVQFGEAGIQHDQTDENTVVVGLASNARYGRVQEFGCVITITKKMAAFLYKKFGWIFWHKIGSTIHIPEHKFMAPALRNCQDRFADKFKDLPLG
jgi:hypothetical protein